jgi:hypothetical protein
LEIIMKKKDLRKRINLKTYAHLPVAQRVWLGETAYVQDFHRSITAMFEPVEGGAATVMCLKTDALKADFLSENLYPESPGAYGNSHACRTFVAMGLRAIKGIRGTRQNRPMKNLSVCAERASAAAYQVIRASGASRTPSNAQPIIRCVPGEAPRVYERDKGGLICISVNWVSSVGNEGIGVLEWGASDRVLVAKAKPNPSVFLAEMGIKCFEVMGMRLGIKAYEVNGYAFTMVINEKRHSIFHENFKRGVTAMQNLIAAEFDAAMKVW